MKAAAKEKLREQARARYRALSAADVQGRSAQIIHRLQTVPEFQRAGHVLVCLSFGNEVNTWLLVEELTRDPSRQVCVPRVERDGVMHIHPYPCRLRTLAMGAAATGSRRAGDTGKLAGRRGDSRSRI
jgi:5-formyltetrahydrofolate cyclo-ligase